MDRDRDDRRLVYSTDGTVALPDARRGPAKQQPAHGFPDDGVIRIAREKRRASSVTLVHGVPPSEVDALAKALKRHCGTGGTQKNGVIEVQGDHRDAIVAYLTSAGKRVKRAGG